jgi:hypothetical protein
VFDTRKVGEPLLKGAVSDNAITSLAAGEQHGDFYAGNGANCSLLPLLAFEVLLNIICLHPILERKTHLS